MTQGDQKKEEAVEEEERWLKLIFARRDATQRLSSLAFSLFFLVSERRVHGTAHLDANLSSRFLVVILGVGQLRLVVRQTL